MRTHDWLSALQGAGNSSVLALMCVGRCMMQHELCFDRQQDRSASIMGQAEVVTPACLNKEKALPSNVPHGSFQSMMLGS